jgi:hypothetical protein
MLKELISVVELVRNSAGGLNSVRAKRARAQAVVELLQIYFSLSDVVKDARTLLDAVGKNPRATLTKIGKAGGPSTVIQWDNLIHRQATRLYNLSGRLLGLDALAVLDPALKNKLQDLIGSKLQGVNNLESIGASLVIYSMLGYGQNDWKWRRSIIVSMYPMQTSVTIDVGAARRELRKLQAALEEFHSLCLKLGTEDEILLLSKKARKQTLLR